MRFSLIAATILVGIGLASTSDVRGQEPPGSERPVIAVLDFTNGSLVDHETYDPFRVGLAGLLITDLAGNSGLEVVERERLRAVLDELALGASGEVDPASAARAGRILGADYIVMGVFVIDRRENLRIDARAVQVETSRVVHVESVDDHADDLLAAVGRLGRRLSEGLDLPGRPGSADSNSDRAVPVRAQVNLKYARAMLEEDRGNPQGALELYEEFLVDLPSGSAPGLRRAVEERVRKLRND